MKRERRGSLGRPTKWENNEDAKIQLAFKLYSIFGATDEKVARCLNVSPETIDHWKQKDEEFKEIAEIGKTMADFKVLESFYKSCTGYEYEEEQIVKTKTGYQKITVKRWKPGDPWSQARWMSLRQRADWSESQKFEITNTHINISKINFEGLTDEEMRFIEGIQIKKIAERNARSLESGSEQSPEG